MQLFAVDGTMARTVADVRLGLSVLAGPHVRDPHSVPVPLDAPAAGARKVAVMADPPGGDTDSRIAEATQAVAAALADAGCMVEEIQAPRYEEVIELWHGLVLGAINTALPQLAPILSDDARAFLEMANSIYDPPTVASEAALWALRQSLMRDWAEFYTQWDVLLTPTWTQLPFRHGADITSADDAMATLLQARPVMPANALGHPSAAVPAAIIEGLPVGVLVNGPSWSELLCLEVAEMIEAAELVPKTPIDPVAG